MLLTHPEQFLAVVSPCTSFSAGAKQTRASKTPNARNLMSVFGKLDLVLLSHDNCCTNNLTKKNEKRAIFSGRCVKQCRCLYLPEDLTDLPQGRSLCYMAQALIRLGRIGLADLCHLLL